jgi:hypothetical protein
MVDGGETGPWNISDEEASEIIRVSDDGFRRSIEAGILSETGRAGSAAQGCREREGSVSWDGPGRWFPGAEATGGVPAPENGEAAEAEAGERKVSACWLCDGLGGVAVSPVHSSVARVKLWAATKLDQGLLYDVRPCPVCAKAEAGLLRDGLAAGRAGGGGE